MRHCDTGQVIPAVLKSLLSLKMLGTTYPVTQHHFPEDLTLQIIGVLL